LLLASATFAFGYATFAFGYATQRQKAKAKGKGKRQRQKATQRQKASNLCLPLLVTVATQLMPSFAFDCSTFAFDYASKGKRRNLCS
jgi:hypothetical protein